MCTLKASRARVMAVRRALLVRPGALAAAVRSVGHVVELESDELRVPLGLAAAAARVPNDGGPLSLSQRLDAGAVSEAAAASMLAAAAAPDWSRVAGGLVCVRRGAALLHFAMRPLMRACGMRAHVPLLQSGFRAACLRLRAEAAEERRTGVLSRILDLQVAAGGNAAAMALERRVGAMAVRARRRKAAALSQQGTRWLARRAVSPHSQSTSR